MTNEERAIRVSIKYLLLSDLRSRDLDMRPDRLIARPLSPIRPKCSCVSDLSKSQCRVVCFDSLPERAVRRDTSSTLQTLRRLHAGPDCHGECTLLRWFPAEQPGRLKRRAQHVRDTLFSISSSPALLGAETMFMNRQKIARVSYLFASRRFAGGDGLCLHGGSFKSTDARACCVNKAQQLASQYGILIVFNVERHRISPPNFKPSLQLLPETVGHCLNFIITSAVFNTEHP
jgi:hypothetical protein